MISVCNVTCSGIPTDGNIDCDMIWQRQKQIVQMCNNYLWPYMWCSIIYRTSVYDMILQRYIQGVGQVSGNLERSEEKDKGSMNKQARDHIQTLPSIQLSPHPFLPCLISNFNLADQVCPILFSTPLFLFSLYFFIDLLKMIPYIFQIII